MKDFKNKVAVVTGAGSGIGRSLAHAFAKRGMKIVLADINEQNLKTVYNELIDAGSDVLEMTVDVSNRDQVAKLAETTYDHFGRANILCNNAGVSSGGPIQSLTLADWDWVLGVNLFGVIYGIKAFLPRMLESGEPCHIVNTSSIGGHITGDNAPYSASNFALVSISEILRAECFNTNVGVSVLCPNFVNTGIVENIERFREGRSEFFNPPDEMTPQFNAMRENLEHLCSTGMSPETVAEKVVIAIQENILHVITHPETLPLIETHIKGIKDDVEKLDKIYTDSIEGIEEIEKEWKIFEYDSPPFTIKYPGDWVELNPSQVPRAVLCASWRSLFNLFILVTDKTDRAFPPAISIENAAKYHARVLKFSGTDVNILSDQQTLLKDGTPANEYVIEFKASGLMRRKQVGIIVLKENTLIDILIGGVSSDYCKDELKKKILYSLEFK